MNKRKITRILTIFFIMLSLLIPNVSNAQSDGGKKKKKVRTEQSAPSKKPAKKRTQTSRPAPSKPVRQAIISDPSGSINGHGWVDLGLPSGLKWATCNVGGNSPADAGNFYAWGETSPKSVYTEKNSKTFRKPFGDISGNPQYDAATANWGASWRMPTKAECQELVNSCTWTFAQYGGKQGYEVKGPNGNTIFLPISGVYYDDKLKYTTFESNFWSSTPNKYSDPYFENNFAFIIDIVDWPAYDFKDSARYPGYSVRAVSK